MEKVTVYLVRHAQTSGNVGMKIMEAGEDVLTDLGKIQTNLLGLHLSTVNFDHVYSSDFARAIKTTEGILKLSKSSSSTQITKSKQLREVDFGIYETTSYKETFAYCKSLNRDIFKWTFPEGESFPGAGKRMLKFIKETCSEILEKWDGQHSPTVLMVSHSAAIALFLHILLTESQSCKVVGLEAHELKLMRNACYLKFEVETRPKSKDMEESFVLFRILEKYYSKHLNCISKMDTADETNPLLEFAKRGSGSKEYVECIQQ